ncbi:hypothetical protein IFM89_034688 [Coptis chinensis]|uniref:Uncharacterized protein n=1 Tax=Coptis chinensis TaxID=261450 RepID=A0A835LU22_9MAGN|nr:hypothetical protein IFM89_034688 [Coptis chinensis]
MAFAPTLQEQEMAYMMLRMNSGEGSDDYGSSVTGSYVEEDFDDSNDDDNESDDDEEEDAFDDAEEGELGVRLMALIGVNDITGWVADDTEDNDDNSQVIFLILDFDVL